MKYLIGFFFGLMVSVALSATPDGFKMDVVMNAGVGPDGKMAQIKVDGDGHVICSTGRQ